jgi:transcriptional regulator GlxA family with amidase domain
VFFLLQDPRDCVEQLFALADWRLQRLARHLATTLHEPLTLRRAAEISGLSPTWFSKYFHAHTGITFSEWYRRVRVERAKILLGEAGLKIEVIAYDVGYRRVGTFERAFRTCTGVCPKGYRAALRSMRGSAPQRMLTDPQQTPIAPQ